MKMPTGGDLKLSTDNSIRKSMRSSFLKMSSFIRKDVSVSRLPNDEPKIKSTSVCKSPYEEIESLKSLHSKLDYLLLNGNDDDCELNTERSENNSKFLQIKRSHWKDVTKAHSCDNCLKDFRFGSKKHNCRRCGNVFCDTCCQFRKRLSPDGVPDPQGNVYRVCIICADLHSQEIGATRSLTNLFCEQRKNKRLVISGELSRLVTGFEKNVDPKSSLKSAIDSLALFKVPEWQKSSKWLESCEVEWCTKCSSNFNFLTRKHHCRLCGYVYCDKCSRTSLLLYFDKNDQGLAKLIGVVGCPDKEPPVSLYLNVCIICEEDLEEYQVQQYHLENTNGNANSKDKLNKLQNILERLNLIEKKIKESLPSFQEQLDTYVFEGNPSKNIDGQNNIELFAKAHADISDLFTQYAIIIQGLKNLDMSSKNELKLMKNIISVKCNQYTTEMNVFKNLKKTMDKSFPPKSLEQFQNFANTQAINNTYVMTRQLGLEALNLSLKYDFGTILAEKLSEADHICYTELENYLHSIGENQKEHLGVLNNLLKVQMKEKTLVLLDKKLVETGGSKYVNCFLIQRCCTILYQILKALKSKSAETQFQKSKQYLRDLVDFVSDLCIKQEKNRL